MDNVTDNLLNIVPSGIISFTDDGIITQVNNHLLDKLKYRSEELVGQNIEKLLTISSRIFYQTHFFPLLKLQGKAEEIFITFLSKNKELVPVLVNAIQHIQNSVSINVCACITVYERKKYEDEILKAKRIAEEALQKNEELQKITAELETGKQELDKQMTRLKHKNKELLQLNELIAHDLQEPVRKISLYIDVIKERQVNVYDEKSEANFNIIVKSANRIRSVLQALQEYVRLSIDDITKSPVDLNTVVALQLQKVAEDFPDVEYSTNVATLPVINGNLLQISILFNELFKNCFQFKSLERNLRLEITASLIKENLYISTEGKYKYIDFVRIMIEDNGIGFRQTHKELIFKILKKLDLKSPGLGFGLATCTRIVENHGGHIAAIGEENKGAIFTVSLPVE